MKVTSSTVECNHNNAVFKSKKTLRKWHSFEVSRIRILPASKIVTSIYVGYTDGGALEISL